MLTGFVIGALIGGVIGVMATAIVVAYGRDDDDAWEPREPGGEP